MNGNKKYDKDFEVFSLKNTAITLNTAVRTQDGSASVTPFLLCIPLFPTITETSVFETVHPHLAYVSVAGCVTDGGPCFSHVRKAKTNCSHTKNTMNSLLLSNPE